MLNIFVKTNIMNGEEVTKVYNDKRVRCFFNIVIPLVLGLGIYVVYRPDTYIAQSAYRLFALNWLRESQFRAECLFLKNYACDMLWAYALCFAMVSVERHKILLPVGLSWGLCILIEIFQWTNVLSGTGDIWDIVCEGIAIFLATCVLVIYERNGTTNEKENN